MSAITLPGTYPGLLRPCSPVAAGDDRAIVEAVIVDAATGTISLELAGRRGRERASTWGLLLANHTGRWHTALWIVAASASDARWRGFTAAELELLELIAWGEDCSDEDVAELHNLAVEVYALLSVPHAG